METTEATTGCLTDCDLGHRWSLCAPAEYAEPSTECISLHQPGSIAYQSTNTHHSLEKFEIASSTVNQSNHRNQQYSVIAVTDDTGAIVERYSYTAYGEPAFFNGSGLLLTPQSSTLFNRFTYTGREYDPTIRLYHYRARMYDPQLGRFCSRDPIGYQGSEWNLYEYVRGRALIAVDPFGRDLISVPSTEEDLLPLLPPLLDIDSVDFPVFPDSPQPSGPDYSPCDGYDFTIGSKCQDKCGVWVDDPYPGKAKDICKKFLEMYGFSKDVKCVANCLGGLEQGSLLHKCRDRNCKRLFNHLHCYAQCDFTPVLGIPPGASEVGWEMLIPDCKSWILDW